MPFRVECPYCNAATVLAEPLARATCSRCGESFAPRAYLEALNEFPSDSIAPPSTASKTQWIPTVALFIALAGGVTAWLMLKPDPTPLPPVVPSPTSTVPPAALVGLQYLPASCNIIAAIQPAALQAYAERTGTDVRTLLGTYGLPPQALDTLDRTGIPLSHIDHLAIGVTLNETKLIPGLTIVLKLRQPIDEDAFLKTLHAERKPQTGKVIYTTKLNGLLMSPVNDTTYLFGMTDDDLAVKPTGKMLFNSGLQKDIQERLSPASFFWMATDRRNWTDASPLLKLEGGKKLATKLTPLRSICAGVSLEPDPTLKIMCDLADDATAKELEAFLKTKFESAAIARDNATLKLLAPANADTVGKLTTLVTDYLK